MLLQKANTQISSAGAFYNEINSKYGLSNTIHLNGYSLGGILAQAVGAQTGVNTVTFNAAGVKEIAGQLCHNQQ
jgi:putative lipase involved disintegration of autophagic bodies